jgi:hypothetical protein
MMGIPAAASLVASLTLACVLGCASPTERVERSSEKLRSWAATLHMAEHQLEGGAIPRRYGRQLLRGAIEAEREERERLEWHLIDPALRRLLADRIARLASILGEPRRYVRAPS